MIKIDYDYWSWWWNHNDDWWWLWNYGLILINAGWWRSWVIMIHNCWQHNLSLIMTIIIDDLRNNFNFDNYHDVWWSYDDDHGSWLWLMPNDPRWLLLIDYDDNHDWRFTDDDWSRMMTDNNDYRWWFIMIYNDRLVMTNWLTDWLIDWWKYHDNKISHNSNSQQAIYADRALVSCANIIDLTGEINKRSFSTQTSGALWAGCNTHPYSPHILWLCVPWQLQDLGFREESIKDMNFSKVYHFPWVNVSLHFFLSVPQ